MYRRLRKLVTKAPWSTKLSMLMAVDGYLDAGLDKADFDERKMATLVAGHNINFNYQYENRIQYAEEPDWMDGMLALTGLDTDHAGSISEALQMKGPAYTMGSACASGNHTLRAAIDEIRYHGVDVAMVVGAVLDFSPVELHAMALLGAITFESFNDDPEHASRPYDTAREGFVPSHGGGALVLEDWDSAIARGAKIYAEIIGVEANSDGNHLPSPSEEGQTFLMKHLLDVCDLKPEQIDYVSAHATSTPLGDRTEHQSIKNVFGDHAKKLKINAPKSLLGHTCWAAPVVETVAVILQMRAGQLHPSINIDNLDPEIDLDVCRGDKPIDHQIEFCLKNSFGFGGINCVSILRNPTELK
ncbi:MAG: beta-ketoacyl-[acyl-carrier-protein] synthase family protein [Deltaproteobacteria bacterium]|nr:beta-ketoacyl-[acyl-carrier-protein] synthase family protein [Deltaproteobacteria bacterium]